MPPPAKLQPPGTRPLANARECRPAGRVEASFFGFRQIEACKIGGAHLSGKRSCPPRQRRLRAPGARHPALLARHRHVVAAPAERVAEPRLKPTWNLIPTAGEANISLLQMQLSQGRCHCALAVPRSISRQPQRKGRGLPRARA